MDHTPRVLHTERIAKTDAQPAKWLLFTHGIYGAGMNWRGIARKIHERRPDWGIVLVDLRQHGKSGPGAPPHTIAACAEDLREVIDAADIPIVALAGHSFGGKVVMATKLLVEPEQTWILDASPSPRAGAIDDTNYSVTNVLVLMERLPKTWPKRDDFVQAIVDAGHAPSLANWLAMNLVSTDAGYVNRLDLAAIREMLTDYWAQDLWRAIDSRVEYVIAARSASVSPSDRAHLATTGAHVHTIDAAHWLHIEAPDQVVDLFATRLP